MFSFFKDKAFFREIFSIALPISLQQLVNASLNMIDVVMVGQLGETAIAAVGLSNQVFFVFIIMLFGLTSGTAIFTAQFWGKGDIESIRKTLGISLAASLLFGAGFSLVALLFPRTALSFYTEDPAVVALGADYLRIVGWSYVPVAVATAYISVLRSVRHVQLTVVVAVAAAAFKTALGYLLIFGVGSFPALGVKGAAISSALAWGVELLLLFVLIYAQKTPLAANPLTFFRFEFPFVLRVLKTASPALANEMFWSLGITAYNAVYARIGTDAIAAVNVNGTIDELAFVVFMGLGNACAVMVGNRIGAGKKEEAYETVRRVIIVSVLAAWAVGAAVILARGLVVRLYALSPAGEHNVRMLMLVMACALWLRMFNFSTFIGALRAGGDTRFALLMEIASMWLIGVPAAYIGAFVLRLPVYLVYLMVTLEELTKAFVSGWRFLSRKWVHDVTDATQTA